MSGSLDRIFVLARITFLEAMRQKVLNILVLFAMIAVGTSLFFSSFTFDEQIKFLKDFSFGTMTIFGLAIALISTAYVIPTELENRTIYTILAKPVYRAEFLIGKYCGIAMLLAMAVALMSCVFTVTLFVQEDILIGDMEHRLTLATQLTESQKTEQLAISVKSIKAQTRNPLIPQAILLIYARLCMVAAMAMVISTVASSAIFTVCTTFMLYIIGHMVGYARDAVMDPAQNFNIVQKYFLSVIITIIPDMRAYSAIDEMVVGTKVTWAMTSTLLGYSGVYIFFALILASILFSQREL